MQILNWLFKGAREQERKNSAVNHPTKSEDTSGKNAKGKEINLQKRDRACKRTKRIEWSKLCCCNYLQLFAFLYRKDIPEACFYSTLNLRRLGSFNKKHSVYPTKMKKEESSREVGNANKADSGAHAGNKVLPITEAPLSYSAGSNDKCDATETKDQTKGHKKKPISRMKELIRWAASAKTEKGGKLNGRKVGVFRRRGTLKEVPDDDQVCNDSPKISFVESCSTISSASSAKSRQTQIAHSTTSIPPAIKTGRLANRVENWIMTDSEYVVLEL